MPSPVDTIPQTTVDFAAFKHLFFALVVGEKYQKVVEVGTDVGDSTRIFSKALQITGGRLLSIDIKPPVDDWPTKTNWEPKNIDFMTQNSANVKLAQPVDLLFLDGDHTYVHIKQELEQLGVWVRMGGKILLHDAFHQEFGEPTQRAVFEFCRKHLLTATFYPHQDGLAVIEVTHALPH